MISNGCGLPGPVLELPLAQLHLPRVGEGQLAQQDLAGLKGSLYFFGHVVHFVDQGVRSVSLIGQGLLRLWVYRLLPFFVEGVIEQFELCDATSDLFDVQSHELLANDLAGVQESWEHLDGAAAAVGGFTEYTLVDFVAQLWWELHEREWLLVLLLGLVVGHFGAW